MDSLKFANPQDAFKYSVGHRVFLTRPPWWKRVLIWLRLIHRYRGSLTIVGVDYAKGEIVVE